MRVLHRSLPGSFVISAMLLLMTPGPTTLGSPARPWLAQSAPAEAAFELWVTSQGQDSLAVLSFPGGEIVDRVPLPPGTQPHITTFSPSGAYAYV
jgi:DNA-binding beta-propeller fold protein YncE